MGRGEQLAEHSHQSVMPAGARLKQGIMLTGFVLAMELAGGLLSNSLALLSDAGHVFTDLVALSLSWYGVRQAERPSDSRMTFGYHRVGVLIAVVNAATIIAIAVIIFYEAYRRWWSPPEVQSLLMLAVAIAGLVANVLVVLWLRREQRNNLNVRSAFWHALGDALASLGVIIGGVVMLVTRWFWVDPLISVLIGIIIAFAAWRILKEGLRVILEATPAQVNIASMIETLKQIPQIKDVHDVHVWSISAELHAMSCHMLIDDIPTSSAGNIRQKVQDLLRQQFHIEHTTLQMECQRCSAQDVFCTLPSGSGGEPEESLPK